MPWLVNLLGTLSDRELNVNLQFEIDCTLSKRGTCLSNQRKTKKKSVFERQYMCTYLKEDHMPIKFVSKKNLLGCPLIISFQRMPIYIRFY